MSPRRAAKRLSEAADAVAAHLGPAAVGVEQHHPCRVAVPDSPTSSPSAPMPRRRSHTRCANAGRSSTCGWNTTRKSLPSPWCLVSVSVLMRRVLPPRSVPTRRPDRRATSTQRTRGSRWNHRSCRTANWRVRTTICSTLSASGRRAVEVGQRSPCTRAPGRRCATGPRSRSARTSSSEAGVDHGVHALLDARRQHVAVPTQADLHDRRSAGRRRDPGRTS